MNKRILYIQYTDPAYYPPLNNSSQILADKGWKILFVGIRGQDQIHLMPHANIKVINLKVRRSHWGIKLGYFQWLLSVLFCVFSFKPMWIYVSDPLAAPVGLLLNQIFKQKIIYHEHDSPEFSKSIESGWTKTMLWARKILAKKAALSVLPNQKRIEIFRQELVPKGPTLRVWNCPMKKEVQLPRQPIAHDQPIILFYHGSLTPERLPESLLEAMTLLDDRIHLKIIGYTVVGFQNYPFFLKEQAEKLNLTRRFHYVEVVSDRNQLLDFSNKADIGISIVPKNAALNLKCMTGASNKSFEYLACGLPLIVSNLPEWQEMFVEPGYALACNLEDAASLAATIQWYLDHPEQMREMGERGRQRIMNEWNYETEFAKVVNFLENN